MLGHFGSNGASEAVVEEYVNINKQVMRGYYSSVRGKKPRFCYSSQLTAQEYQEAAVELREIHQAIQADVLLSNLEEIQVSLPPSKIMMPILDYIYLNLRSLALRRQNLCSVLQT
jgi:hypothetical protein